MKIVYQIDARGWPHELKVLLGGSDEEIRWVDANALPDEIATGVLVDFDRSGRCCGVEVSNVALIAPWRGGKSRRWGVVRPLKEGRLLLPQGAIPSRQHLIAWCEGITGLAGDADEGVSLHWRSKRAYDYSTELDELDGEVGWLRIGISDELLVGLQFTAPSEHLRGLQI